MPSGQTDHLCRFRPYCLAPGLSGLLDVLGLSDHAPSAGERHLDRLQRADQRQLRAGRCLWNINEGTEHLMVDFGLVTAQMLVWGLVCVNTRHLHT